MIWNSDSALHFSFKPNHSLLPEKQRLHNCSQLIYLDLINQPCNEILPATLQATVSGRIQSSGPRLRLRTGINRHLFLAGYEMGLGGWRGGNGNLWLLAVNTRAGLSLDGWLTSRVLTDFRISSPYITQHITHMFLCYMPGIQLNLIIPRFYLSKFIDLPKSALESTLSAYTQNLSP